MFISQSEIQVLTGLRQPSAQRRHLTRVGIPFTKDIAGRPIVLRSALENPKANSNQPNWDALRIPEKSAAQ